MSVINKKMLFVIKVIIPFYCRALEKLNGNEKISRNYPRIFKNIIFLIFFIIYIDSLLLADDAFFHPLYYASHYK